MRLLALLLVTVGTVTAQPVTVHLEAGRLGDSALFPPGAPKFMTGRPLDDGPPPGVALPAPLESVRHAALPFDGAAAPLFVVVGVRAGGEVAAFAGVTTGGRGLEALHPVEPDPAFGAGPAGVVELPLAEGRPVLVEVWLDPVQGYVWARQADFRYGTVELDGVERAVALVRAPTATRYEAGPATSVFVDRNGDGRFGSGAEAGVAGFEFPEMQAADKPIRVENGGLRLASVAPDGSEAVFETVADVEALAVGFRLPDLELERLNGTRLRLSDLRGRVVVLNWWADYCAPCYREMPGLNELVGQYADDPRVVFLAVADNTREEVEVALSRHTFEYAHALASETSRALFADGYPRHVILDPDGRVAFDFIGGFPTVHQVLDSVVRPLLASVP